MAGGPKKHLKRISTPKNWCLDKLDGIYAPRPSAGPHKLRECIPLAILLRNRLKYALNYDEVKLIVMQKMIRIDGKIRTDKTFPVGFQDVVSIEKTNENFRILYDVKGRFIAHKISENEANFKLCKVRKIMIGSKKIPYAYLNDGKTIRYASPEMKVNDTVKFNLVEKKVVEILPFKIGSIGMITGGRSVGRIGKVIKRTAAPGSIDSVTLKDARGDVFSTLITNVFIIGDSDKTVITLPKDKGIKKSILEEQEEKGLTVF